MAGALAIVTSEQTEGPTEYSIARQWGVHFARFFNFPTTETTCPSLRRPIAGYRRSCLRGGTWIATDSQTASVRFLNHDSVSGAILVVVLNGKILEEHYISKLQFTWPQVSCVSGFPPRGCRAVIVSYTDASDEIKKFALRFTATNEAELFLYALKGNLKDAGEPWELDSGHRSDISAGSKQMALHIGRPSGSRKTKSLTELVNTATSNSCSMEMPANSDSDFEKHSCIQEKMHNENSESAYPAMPSSFTLQLTDDCPSHEKGYQLTTTHGVLSSRTSEELCLSNASGSHSQLNPKSEQHSRIQGAKPNRKTDGVFPSLPPSFTSLLNDCCSSAEQGSQSTATCTSTPKRKRGDESLSTAATDDSYTPEMETVLSPGVEYHFYSQETTFNKKSQGIVPAMSPRFTSLLASECSNGVQATNQQNVSGENDLKSQIMRYMEDSSFQEMIFKVEKIIDELGGL